MDHFKFLHILSDFILPVSNVGTINHVSTVISWGGCNLEPMERNFIGLNIVCKTLTQLEIVFFQNNTYDHFNTNISNCLYYENNHNTLDFMPNS